MSATQSKNSPATALAKMAQELLGGKKSAEAAPVKGDDTSHPSGSVDDKTQPMTEGARSAENTKDVKEIVGAPAIDNSPGPNPKDPTPLDMGLSAAPTGDDPAIERDIKSKPLDPGTTHPARVDEGEKYSFDQLLALHSQITDPILAELIVDRNKSAATQPAATSPAQTPAATTATTPANATSLDFAAGYNAAGMVGVQKEAVTQMVAQTIADGWADGALDADILAGYLKKRAADEAEGSSEGSEKPKPSSDKPAAEGAPSGDAPPSGDGGGMGGPPAGGMGGGGGGGIPPELLALLQGGAGGGGGMGGGGMEGGGMGGGGMGGPPGAMAGMGGEELLAQLLAALQEMHAQPSDLAEAGPPDAAGVPAGAKVAAAAKAFARSGKYKLKEAADGTPARIVRDYFKAAISRLLSAA